MTMVTLLGDNLNYLTPVIFEFKDKIKHHIIICDDAMHELSKANQLQKGFDNLVEKYNLSCQSHLLRVDEDSKTDIMRIFMQIKSIEPEASNICLNATEGYAATTLLLSNFVLGELGKVISYDLIDNEYNMIQAQGFETKKIENSMCLDDYLLLLNNTILIEKKEKEFHNNKEIVLSLFKEYRSFTKVKKALINDYYSLDFSRYASVLESLKSLEIIDERNNLIPSMRMQLQGNLFEEYVYWLCKPLGFDDIRMGVKIDFDQIKDRSEVPEHINNEFDILMIKNNRIFTIECKLSNHLEGLELVYKYDTIMDYFGADTKAILLNISSKEKKPYLNSNRSESFNRSSIRRAFSSNMRVYHESSLEPIKFTNLITNFFS